MKTKKIIFIFLLIGCGSFAQSIKKVEKLIVNYQKCLDNGVDMLGCSNNYYIEIDNLLNEVYKKIRLKINSLEKEKLKNEQKNWLINRDLYFKKAYSEAKDEADGLSNNDLQMIYIDKKAEYVKNRVVALVEKYRV
ncbi:lysozyme inhibitor LprI family protein [Flavobacterium sp. WV_118_3]|uniref:lysozyme inhibitor LprI family protein n=1 Tax=Flavobacterium sp. WV_118_3 TaxID=3151764 RepID=UPI00321C1480